MISPGFSQMLDFIYHMYTVLHIKIQIPGLKTITLNICDIILFIGIYILISQDLENQNKNHKNTKTNIETQTETETNISKSNYMLDYRYEQILKENPECQLLLHDGKYYTVDITDSKKGGKVYNADTLLWSGYWLYNRPIEMLEDEDDTIENHHNKLLGSITLDKTFHIVLDEFVKEFIIENSYEHVSDLDIEMIYTLWIEKNGLMVPIIMSDVLHYLDNRFGRFGYVSMFVGIGINQKAYEKLIKETDTDEDDEYYMNPEYYQIWNNWY